MRSLIYSHLQLTLLSIYFLISFTSCVTLNSLPSQNVPTFTDKNQFEGTASAGLSGLNANLAYSPLKHLSVHVNAFTSLSDKFAATNNIYSNSFNNQIEGGLGFYFPEKSFIYGANIGYGQGAVSWERWYRPDSGDRKPFSYQKFDTQWKMYLNTFFAYKIRHESFSGLSFRASYFKNYYYESIISSDYIANRIYYKNKAIKGIGLTATYFMKLKIANHFYFINEDGVSYSTTAVPNLVLRVGFMLKF